MTYMTRQQQAILACIQSCDGGIGACTAIWSGWKRQARFTKL